jgi:hypothetical protein
MDANEAIALAVRAFLERMAALIAEEARRMVEVAK